MTCNTMGLVSVDQGLNLLTRTPSEQPQPSSYIDGSLMDMVSFEMFNGTTPVSDLQSKSRPHLDLFSSMMKSICNCLACAFDGLEAFDEQFDQYERRDVSGVRCPCDKTRYERSVLDAAVRESLW